MACLIKWHSQTIKCQLLRKQKHKQLAAPNKATQALLSLRFSQSVCSNVAQVHSQADLKQHPVGNDFCSANCTHLSLRCFWQDNY